MAQLEFKTLSFQLKKDYLQVNLLNIFTTNLPLSELENFGFSDLKDKHTLNFPKLNENKAETKFSFLLLKYFENLINTINGNKALYIHRNSGIPLIGNVSFGIVYRNTSLIEIKPVTSCNLNCIYCAVGEGKSSNKIDFVVEKDYLVEELQKLIDFVAEPVEVHIGVQGEPFLYADLIPLIEDLQNNPQITIVSMDSNFTLVSKSMIDKLAQFDKLRLNISLDAIDPLIAEKMAGTTYNLKQVQEMIRYTAKKRVKILIAPVLVPGYNQEEMEKIINFVKELGLVEKIQHPILGIQNFLNYKTGRNPVKALPWEDFYKIISNLEQKTGVNLRLSPERFGIRKTKVLNLPFKEGEIINATLKSEDRFPNTCIAVSKNRSISVADCKFINEKNVKLKITRDKHNIFAGKIVR